MKKFLFMLTAALLLLGTTSCLDSNEDDQETTLRAVMTNRAVPLSGTPVVSLANYSLELNISQATLSVSGAAKLPDGSTVQFTTPEMKMSQVGSTSAFSFSTSQVSGSISALSGTFDVSTGHLYLAFQSGSATVYATSGVSMPYATTIITDTTTSAQPVINGTSGYYFSIDPETMQGSLTIRNYGNGAATTSNKITFKASGLTATATESGYTFTAAKLAGTSNFGTDTLYDVVANVTAGGQTLNMTYRNGSTKATVRGYMFQQSN